MFNLTIKPIIKIDQTDLISALQSEPYKGNHKYGAEILRAFICEVRTNKHLIFGNNLQVDFVTNGYHQIKSIKNDGIEYSFKQVLRLLNKVTK